ncbi:MAG: T9SS type A sorting domain-containing protein [Chitinophagales bacterium]|nr:T9SS type A sorting domain-containing protein [Chitinophagales bacterium]
MKHFFSRKAWWLCCVFATACFVVLNLSFRHTEAVFHSEEELRAFRDGSRSPIDSGEYFLGSITCKGCHGFDSAHLANVDENGNDINLYDDWEASMMAFSAVDPFWRAKVSHEILVNPAHANELQSKCTQCHAPMGHFTAMFKGAAHYTLADVLTDTLGLNGVACGACHSIGSDSIFGLNFSGNIHYDTSRVEYGPFQNPELGPMQLYVGLTPKYSPHVSRSKVCAPCHTLITKTADLNGNYTGNTFVEQATYHEWLNSAYNDSVPCQRCHMPQINDPVIIANGLQNLSPRSPFNLHKFMGGNSTMLRLIKQNKSLLGITVPDEHIDSSISATLNLLQHSTLQMQLSTDSITADTLYVSVKLTNKAGHKFPSGYPSRRAFLQIAVTNASDTVFRSGMLQPDGELIGHDSQFEPHHHIITNEQQVQIYEMVMGDVNGNFTTVLERAAVTLKDNRLPPVGFTAQHSAYDTARIEGNATTDPDFNKNGTTQGTGTDVVHYHIPINSLSGNLRVSAAVYYQTLPPRWFTEMFTYNSSFIDSFRTMYSNADKAPVLIAQGVLDSIALFSSIGESVAENNFIVFPVPSFDGRVIVENKSGKEITSIEILDVTGKLLKIVSPQENKQVLVLTLPEKEGVYWLKIKSGKGVVFKKVLRQ